MTDRAAWEFLRGEGADGYPVPSNFETFAAYVRAGRAAFGSQKNRPRRGRKGRSIVSEDGL